MKEILQKSRENKFIKLLINLLSSKFFPFILIPISLLCYYLSLDMVMIYIIGIFGSLIFILLEDVSPSVAVFSFMALLVSEKNSPLVFAETATNYYFRTANLVQIIIVITVFSSSLIYRAVLNIIGKKFSVSPIFLCLCAFAAVLMLNGVFSKDYNPKNLLYGLIMALCFSGIFTAVKDNIFKNQDSFVKIAYGFFALGIVLIIELAVKYITAENLIINGNINREMLTFGWGIWNTMGMYLVLCLPFIVYLAGKEKTGYIFASFSVVVFIAVFMSCSRQSIIGAILVYPISLLLLFIKGKNRLLNSVVMSVVLDALVIFLLCFKDNLFKYFIELFKQIVVNGELSGSGRKMIWEEALEHFKSAPILGAGFYVKMSAAHFSGLGFIPTMAHNTIMQILSSCGIIGLIVYLSHRVLTGVSYFKNITVERSYLFLGIVGFLIICLFDNHIFNIFPTIIYSCLIGALSASEKKKNTPVPNP